MAVAAVTVAAVAPKNTMLLAAVVLKFVPVMVTEVPTGPEAGEKLEIPGRLEFGACAPAWITAIVRDIPPPITVIVPSR